MPTPVLPTRVTVTISEIDAGGTALEGRVIFTPSVKSKTDDGTAINTTPVIVHVTAGAASTELVATDAAGVTPSGWLYRVDKVLGPPGSSGALGTDAWVRETFWVSLPAANPTVNLDDLTRVEAPPTTQFEVTKVSGVPADVTGNVPLTGTDLELAGIGFIGTGSRGVANGVATLDSAVHVPMTQLAQGANGVATLDATAHVPTAQLPTGVVNQTVGTTAGTVAAGDDSRITVTQSGTIGNTVLGTRVTTLEGQKSGSSYGIWADNGGNVNGQSVAQGVGGGDGGSKITDIGTVVETPVGCSLASGTLTATVAGKWLFHLSTQYTGGNTAERAIYLCKSTVANNPPGTRYGLIAAPSVDALATSCRITLTAGQQVSVYVACWTTSASVTLWKAGGNVLTATWLGP
jgi:hypothetical protein